MGINTNMIKRRHSKKDENQISTAALPDIIFMLLFFFMVVTVLKTEKPKVIFELPEADELTKIQHKSYQSNIYIGDIKNHEESPATRIQFNDKFININEIQTGIVNVISQYDYADPAKISFSLKIDKDARMKVVEDVKSQIKKTEFRKVNYIALASNK